MYTEIAKRYLSFLKATCKPNTKANAWTFLAFCEEYEHLDSEHAGMIIYNLITL